jgi:hypothetical protein
VSPTPAREITSIFITGAANNASPHFGQQPSC